MIVVDRVEDQTAVLEIAGRMVDVPLAELPAGVKEGDRLAFVVLPPSEEDDAKARLARLKARTPQGPGSFDL
ncbi:MAG: DUF3006 domain-containing protein [Pseudomonadota bacterium]|nr:DUF3006 domain-containing protein [Pseudomonadota bacterium]